LDRSVPGAAGRLIAGWLPRLAGLFVSGSVAWLIRPHPAPNSLTWTSAAAWSTVYVLLSVAAGLGAIAGTLAVVPLRSPRTQFRIAGALACLPPLAVFLSRESMWASLAAMAFGWYLAKAQRWNQRRPTLPAQPSESLFQTYYALEGQPRLPAIGALLAVACAIGGIYTALRGSTIESAGFWGAASTMVAWTSNRFRLPPGIGQGGISVRRAAAPVPVAILIILASLIPFLRSGAARRSGTALEQTAQAGSASGGTYKGVILLTPSVPKRVTSPLPFVAHKPFAGHPTDPLSIPFDGVYWVLRWPQTQPPPGSFVLTGTPLDSVFRTSDRFPLFMEARQQFGSPIDLGCCSRIQLAVRSADQSITFNMVLRNTKQPGPSVNLGRGSAASPLAVSTGRPGEPVRMLINFEVPRHPLLEQFDEATITFNRSFAFASPKVAIEQFIFIPRGF
jgi:hypothetical protein